MVVTKLRITFKNDRQQYQDKKYCVLPPFGAKKLIIVKKIVISIPLAVLQGRVMSSLKNSVLYLSLQFEYGTPNFPTFPLPDGLTKADLGQKMVDFPERRNFLDE